MTKKINYNFPAAEIRKEGKKNPGVVNIILPENASFLEKIKHELAQKLLAYQQDNNLTFEEMASRLGLSLSSTMEVLRGNINAFALDSLISYTEKLPLNLQVKITSEKGLGVNH